MDRCGQNEISLGLRRNRTSDSLNSKESRIPVNPAPEEGGEKAETHRPVYPGRLEKNNTGQAGSK